MFDYKGENLFLKRYLKKHIWPCLKERIEIGVTTRQQIPVLSMTYLTRLTIDIDLFQNPFGVLYFDLRNQKEELKSGSTKLELKYTLSTPNAEYNMFALILHEEEISVDVMSG